METFIQQEIENGLLSEINEAFTSYFTKVWDERSAKLSWNDVEALRSECFDIIETVEDRKPEKERGCTDARMGLLLLHFQRVVWQRIE